MTTTKQNPVLDNINQATVDQIATFIRIKSEKDGRILYSRMDNGFMCIAYRTSTGYFVRAKYDQYGAQIAKEYFTHWNDNQNEPCNLLFQTNQNKSNA